MPKRKSAGPRTSQEKETITVELKASSEMIHFKRVSRGMQRDELILFTVIRIVSDRRVEGATGGPGSTMTQAWQAVYMQGDSILGFLNSTVCIMHQIYSRMIDCPRESLVHGNLSIVPLTLAFSSVPFTT